MSAYPTLPPLKLSTTCIVPPQYHSAMNYSPSFTESRPAPPIPSQPDENRDSRHSPSPSLSPSLGLRKSLSVDSFVQFRRDGPSKVGQRQNRVIASSSVPPSQAVKTEKEGISRTTRYRGASVTGAVGDYHRSTVGDRAFERTDPLGRLHEVSSRTSLKGQDKIRSFIKAGELPLPSRTPTLSSTSSMSSMSGASSSSLEHAPRLQSALSMQAMTRRGNPLVGVTGRARSGSLGVYVSQSGKPSFINTQVPARQSLNENADVSLIIVGAPNCGKSTAIHKGLKGYGLSEPVISTLPSGLYDEHISSRYTRRVGRVAQSEYNPDCALNVLEITASGRRANQPVKTGSFWPDRVPPADGVIACYDASDPQSFAPIEDLLRGYYAPNISILVLACKSDLDGAIDPQKAIEVLLRYDVGLVEVSNTHEGKEKMRRSFDWLLKAIFRERAESANGESGSHRNPASPDILVSSHPPWESSRTATPTASSSVASMNTVVPKKAPISRPALVSSPSASQPPSHSPTRARSTGDLLSEHERSKNRDWPLDKDGANHSNGITRLPNNSTESFHRSKPSDGDVVGTFPRDDHAERVAGTRTAPWATLEELLDKLVFLTVSGDDPAFISHFLLTYRRFASPRSVLLAMQKRMRQLDTASGDPMFACFAQMRICYLLEMWIQNYPHDFAVRGTAGALSALIKSIIGKTHLLHYGSDFLPFLEVLPNLVDKDAAWALKPDDIADENDDVYSLCDDDDDGTLTNDVDPPEAAQFSPTLAGNQAIPELGSLRDRKSNIPLAGRALASPQMTTTPSLDGFDMPLKQVCRDLVKVAQELNTYDSEEVAQEITRMEAKMFLEIEPRNWLQYCLVSGKKDPETDPIVHFNDMSNHLAAWVVSLILCHDRAKARAKQIEKFVDIAHKLRALNNYSALRAFVAGINSSTFPGDETMEIFKSKAPDQAKNLQSWDLLLKRISSHRAYRMALKNSKGACIPALEVHMSDLIGAHEGNPDENVNDPTQLHWGKFNIMGKFINTITVCQVQCRNTNDYDFPDRSYIRALIMKRPLMTDEMQKSRIAPPDDVDGEEVFRPPFPRVVSRDPSGTKDPLLRKFIFW